LAIKSGERKATENILYSDEKARPERTKMMPDSEVDELWKLTL
jgi:hypothetical protein